MTSFQYISQYLLEILTNKKHFNIVDELQHANIKKREDNLKNLLKNNPFEIDKSIFEPFIKKDDKSSYMEIINTIQDNTFKEMMLEELNLLNDYKELWNKELVDEFKGLRGNPRSIKHIELFQRLFFDKLRIDKKKIKIDENLNLCYIEGQIEIATKLSDILESIEILHKDGKSLFFRGHDNVSYRLIPSIYRGNAPFYEKEIFYDTISTIPQEVNGISSAFEILTKFQHFGTPTRLLDITTNPLVALFFACKSKSADGELLVFGEESSKIKLFDSDTVSVLTNLVKLPWHFSINCATDTIVSSNFDELTHKIRNEKPYFQNIIRCDDLKKSFFVKPKLDNPRIIKQSGAFIVCGMDDIKYKPSKEIFDIEKNKVIKRIIISKHLKDRLNKSLDVFSISSGTLFPELSDVASYVKNKYGVR